MEADRNYEALGAAVAALRGAAAVLRGPVPEVWFARAWIEPVGPGTKSLREVVADYCSQIASDLEANGAGDHQGDRGLGRLVLEYVDPRTSDPFHDAANAASGALRSVYKS